MVVLSSTIQPCTQNDILSRTKNKEDTSDTDCLSNEAEQYISYKSKSSAKIRNLSNQKPNPALKTKKEITNINITNSQNTKRIHVQPSEQLFPKRWPLSNLNRTKINLNIQKMKRHRNSDTKKQATENHNNTTALERSVIISWGLKLVSHAQPHPQFLNWYKQLVGCLFRMITL